MTSKLQSPIRTRASSADPVGRHRDALVERREHRQARRLPQQFRDAADVVVVVMGEQDRRRAQALVDGLAHRTGFARIDDQGRTVAVAQRPDVVVGEGGQGAQLHGGGELHADGGLRVPFRMTTMPAMPDHGQTTTVPPQASASAWFATPPGLAILDSEAELILHALAERPAQPWLWLTPLLPGSMTRQPEGRGLRLAPDGQAWQGSVHCGLPWPIASESFGSVVLQHVVRSRASSQLLLEECARILSPGGVLWLFGLNPLAPYRLALACERPACLGAAHVAAAPARGRTRRRRRCRKGSVRVGGSLPMPVRRMALACAPLTPCAPRSARFR